MEHRNIGAHPFNVGDEVSITGYDAPWNGHRFIVEDIKPHHDKDHGTLLKMSVEDARTLWEKLGEAQWWMAAADDGFDNIWWWEGFLTLTHPASLENE